MQNKAELTIPSNSVNLNGITSENFVELPLPSKNQHMGKSIVKKLLIEGENVISSVQFNARPNNNGDTRTVSRDINNDFVKSNAAGLHRVGTTVNYENRQMASVGTGELESKLLGSPNSGSIEQMTCASMFGKQYLLVGNENGLNVIDFSINPELMKPKPLIRGCSFRKIQVLDEYGIMIAIAGKKQMVRIYKLDSLLHLIKFMIQPKTEKPVDFSKTPTFLKKITDTIPRCENCGIQLDEIISLEGCLKPIKTVCQNCKEIRRRSSSSILSTSSTESNSLIPGKLHQRTMSNITSHLTDYIQHQLSNSLDNVDISAEEKANAWHWSTNYVKLDNAKDCITFDVKETKSYLYLTVVTPHHMIHLYNCEVSAKNTPDFKFELAQTFWVPETPDFISVSADAFVINKIYTGINGKAAVIECHSSIVTEINMQKNLIPRFVENPVWRSFTPLPRTCSLEFLIENPVEFDAVPVIPLSTIPKSPPSPASPTTPPPLDSLDSLDSTNNTKFVNELNNNPLRRSTYRNRKSISSSDILDSNPKRSRRRSAILTGETLNSETSPLDSVAFMFPKQQGDQEQHDLISTISPPTSPSCNLSNISAQQGTISTMQISMTAQLDYVPFPTKSLNQTQLPYSSLISDQGSHKKTKSNSSENKKRTSIEVPSPSSLFLATVDNLSHLVNDKGEPYKYNRPIRWSSSPNDISLLPSFNDIYVIGFQNNVIELASMKSGKIIRKITSGCPVKFLGESCRKKDLNSKTGKDFREKDKVPELECGMRRNIFWTCELGEEYYFYRGRVLD